jgi:hypothetical protein
MPSGTASTPSKYFCQVTRLPGLQGGGVGRTGSAEGRHAGRDEEGGKGPRAGASGNGKGHGTGTCSRAGGQAAHLYPSPQTLASTRLSTCPPGVVSSEAVPPHDEV